MALATRSLALSSLILSFFASSFFALRSLALSLLGLRFLALFSFVSRSSIYRSLAASLYTSEHFASFLRIVDSALKVVLYAMRLNVIVYKIVHILEKGVF
jgi:hypothetical protein